ncbi:related to 4-coumarate--CoA ligase 1 [Armillaria ostoyae]|uniref:Related to 4-coumarate--CoA ligase 1 n=1 Tax=Armillaria ostoyae TaxID=47428 RepID=A0A284S0V0_ARMOS|nr:related to 4-coumarate--CoA ligase 1 [Armillaria ostoyae]
MNAKRWNPCCSLEEADRTLTAPGSILEIETRVIDGRVSKVWKNLWPSIRAFFLQSANEHPEKTYVVFEKERYTFQEILDEAVKCAAIFRDVYRVKKGDRVVICSRNFPSYYIVFWACHLLGAVTALVNAWLPLETLRHCITLTNCSLIILDPERADKIGPTATDLKRASGTSGYLVIQDHEGKGFWEGMDAWSTMRSKYDMDPKGILEDDPQVSPDDDAMIIFTSGTTGLPKGALSTQRALLSTLFSRAAMAGRDAVRRGVPYPSPPVSSPQQQSILLPTPLFHVTGIRTSFTGTSQGIKLVLMRKWNVEEAIKLCRAENVTSLGGVPSTVSDLADSTPSGLSIKSITFGGAPVAPSLVKRSEQAFPHAVFGQAYGLTETNAASVGVVGPDYAAKLDSCGFILPPNEIIIMKDGVEAAPGEAGEIWLRGPNIMKGYFGDPAATDKKVLTKDGWFKTGDLGCIDEEGYVYIKDRIKDIIIRGGENIDSTSVENALYTEPGVLEAAAVGVPDERLGELVTALVTIKPEYHGKVDEKKLLAVAEKLLPKFAVPVMIILHDGDFDHTPSGKLIKTQLRKIARQEWARTRRSMRDFDAGKSKL